MKSISIHSVQRAIRGTLLSSSIMLASAGLAAAQTPNPIFLPPNQAQAVVQPKTSPTGSLDKWIALQSGLYDVIASFSQQASRMQRYLQAFERRQMEIHLARMLTPGGPQNYIEPDRTIEEQAAYEAVAREPGLCANLDKALKAYISKHSHELDTVISALVRETQALDDAQKAEIAAKLQVALAGMTQKKRAQEILFPCLYKNKNELDQPRAYSVEKTLKDWYRIQLPLIDAWLGEVD